MTLLITRLYNFFIILKTLYPKMISTGIMIHSLITRINKESVKGIPYITCNQYGVKQKVINISTITTEIIRSEERRVGKECRL